ncbi:uncharacterized protein ISCGN_020735 [Ixodes scapularis]
MPPLQPAPALQVQLLSPVRRTTPQLQAQDSRPRSSTPIPPDSEVSVSNVLDRPSYAGDSNDPEDRPDDPWDSDSRTKSDDSGSCDSDTSTNVDDESAEDSSDSDEEEDDMEERVAPGDTSYAPSTNVSFQSDDSDCVKVPLHKERKFIVFEGCLLERFKVCRKCHAPCCNTTDVVGTLLIVNRRHGGASQRCMSSRTLSFCKVSEARALPLLGWTLRFARIQCKVLHLQVPQGSHQEGHPC